MVILSTISSRTGVPPVTYVIVTLFYERYNRTINQTVIPPARVDGKSPLERGAGVCPPPLPGVGGGEHLILLQKPQCVTKLYIILHQKFCNCLNFKVFFIGTYFAILKDG
jgi:hypothetical protein